MNWDLKFYVVIFLNKLLVEVPKSVLHLHSHEQRPQQQRLPPRIHTCTGGTWSLRQLADITDVMQFGNLCISKYFQLEFRSTYPASLNDCVNEKQVFSSYLEKLCSMLAILLEAKDTDVSPH